MSTLTAGATYHYQAVASNSFSAGCKAARKWGCGCGGRPGRKSPSLPGTGRGIWPRSADVTPVSHRRSACGPPASLAS